jgi:hypothetical protein
MRPFGARAHRRASAAKGLGEEESAGQSLPCPIDDLSGLADRKICGRFAKSPNGAPKGALFPVIFVPPDKISLAPCSRPSRGFRGINGFLPTRGGIASGLLTKDTSAPRAGPLHLFHDPLTAAVRGAVRKASGRGTSVARDMFAATPAGGVEQGTIPFPSRLRALFRCKVVANLSP